MDSRDTWASLQYLSWASQYRGNARADPGVPNMVGSVADTAGLNKKALFEGSTEVYRTPQMGPCRHSTRPRITRSRRLRRDLDPQAVALVGFDIATSIYHPLKPTLKGVAFTIWAQKPVRTTSARVALSNKVIRKVSFPRGFGSQTRSSNDYRTLAQFE